MIFLGLDWAEDHHDVCLMSESGEVVAERRVDDGVVGVEAIHAVVAEHRREGETVVVGCETAHGLVQQALIAVGYELHEINPLAANRYRDRHSLSGAKSDRGDARMLADVVRTDRHHHPIFQGNSDLAEAIQILARTHQSLIHRRQTELNSLRSMLRLSYPQMLAAFPKLASPGERDCPDAMAVIERAPTPSAGRRLSTTQIATALRKAGRKLYVDRRTGEIRDALRHFQLESAGMTADAYGISARALARVVMSMSREIDQLGTELSIHFEKHPDAKIIRSLPGLGLVLGARVVGEFGDAPNQYADARARKNYATTAPVTRASGRQRVVLARHGGNRILGDACLRWAFCAVQTSPGARRCYDTARRREKSHAAALRVVANRLVGILHGCLRYRTDYDESRAWPQPVTSSEAAA